MVRKLKFRNYKSFRNWQEIELAPITVLIGKNSSGKSAISKLLTLISASLSGAMETPLAFKNKEISIGLSNSDLVYNKNITTSLLQFVVSSPENEIALTVAIDRKDSASILEWSLNGTAIDVEKTRFKGFLPESRPIAGLALDYDYIGPVRIQPAPIFFSQATDTSTVGYDGSNAYGILIDDFQGANKILPKVSEWYKQNFEDWNIEIIEISTGDPSYQIVLSNQAIKQINITNVGQGINQTLPLIVRSFIKDEKKVAIIIEEPETHLHPSAHGNLAERFVTSYLDDPKKNYFIETHSQNFVLRLRRLVAENKLHVNSLALYYVDFEQDDNESTISRITVKDDGGVDWWPEGIFNETLLETRAISNVQTAIK
jgi:predicted ATPase